jgi:hypothetical protein
MAERLSAARVLGTISKILVKNKAISALMIAIAFIVMLFVTYSYELLLGHKEGFRYATQEFVDALFAKVQADPHASAIMPLPAADWATFGGLLLLYALLFGTILFIMVNIAGNLFDNEKPSWRGIQKKLPILLPFLLLYFLVSFLFDDLYIVALAAFWASEFMSHLSTIASSLVYLGLIVGPPLILGITYIYLRCYSYPPCMIIGGQAGFSSLVCSWRKTRGNVFQLLLIIVIFKIFLRGIFLMLGLGLAAFFAHMLKGVINLFAFQAMLTALSSAVYFWLTTLLATYIFKRC